MYRKARFGDKNVAWGRTIKIKFMNAEDHSLTSYIFSNITVVTKIALRLLCCQEQNRQCFSGKGSSFLLIK